MSILIKGMEMPTHCDLCELTTWDSNAGESRCFFTGNYTSANYDLLHGNCPLVPVPPHGRLIEEDKVFDIVFEWCPDDDGSVGKVGDLREMLDEIESLPAIIEAEEDEQ